MIRYRKSFLISLLMLLIPGLYLATMARTLVLGDPTEYTFVANILGIAHPPGYAVITLLGKLFQSLIPFGSIPWRMHLLSVTTATTAALLIFGVVRTIGQLPELKLPPWLVTLVAVFSAVTAATAADIWQHAIHANPHIMTAAFLIANLYFLTKWWAQNRNLDLAARSDRWLLVFCLSAGLGVAHHPLTVFAFPAYALFILWSQPSIWRQWRRLLKMISLALLGLSVWLYFPIRSPMEPAFGPSTMNTLNGFLDHVLARGLSESLPYYGWADQLNRAVVFWTLLKLQYAVPIILLSTFGLVWLFRSSRRPLFLLYLLAFAGNYAFVISLKAQDIMAYLLGPFLLLGMLSGVGLLGVLTILQDRAQVRARGVLLTVGLFILLGPVLQISRNAPLISLRDYDEGNAYVDELFRTFQGTNKGAVLLNDWEHMTPLWYTRFVDDRWPDERDVRPEFVSAARSWLQNVFDFLPGGPVYLSNFRRDVVDAGFRLRPMGSFYQVVEPGDASLPADLTPVSIPGSEVELVGYLLPKTEVTAGDFIPVTLAMRAPQGTEEYYVPVLAVAGVSYPFTTDSHVTSPDWVPGEIIVERFDIALPHDLAGGDYPVTANLRNLSQDQTIPLDVVIGNLSVTAQDHPVDTSHLLANFRQRVGLMGATARSNGQRRQAPWPDPISVQPGDIIHLAFRWESLAPAEESYTIFIHLIDLANQPVVDNLDYTPLGGAMPTHLWIPKWLPGQQMSDPYRMQVPAELPPGEYLIEVGLYEMVGKRRLLMSDLDGNLIGDRYILGEVVVEP